MYEKIEKLDGVTMYKMIDALLHYDYFSTKCLVELLIEKRTEEEERRILKQIQELLFKQENEAVFKLLEECITKKKPKRKRKWRFIK